MAGSSTHVSKVLAVEEDGRYVQLRPSPSWSNVRSASRTPRSVEAGVSGS
jgi:hypothetical protein